MENSPHTLQRISRLRPAVLLSLVTCQCARRIKSFIPRKDFEHCHSLCPRFFCWKRLDRCNRVVLSQASGAWRCPFKARWWTSGGLTCCREITFGVECVDDEVRHETLALWPLAEGARRGCFGPRMVTSGLRICHLLIPTADLLGLGVGQRPRETKALCLWVPDRRRSFACCPGPSKRTSDSTGW